jgi:hypothetical protein
VAAGRARLQCVEKELVLVLATNTRANQFANGAAPLRDRGAASGFFESYVASERQRVTDELATFLVRNDFKRGG